MSELKDESLVLEENGFKIEFGSSEGKQPIEYREMVYYSPRADVIVTAQPIYAKELGGEMFSAFVFIGYLVTNEHLSFFLAEDAFKEVFELIGEFGEKENEQKTA